MRAVQVAAAKGPFELVERDIPEPGLGQVRIKVKACGVCHGDFVTKEGVMPQVTYPRIPGHEVAGIVDAVGVGVEKWKPGDRAGVGWHGGHCGECDACLRGDFFSCRSFTEITGATCDGGYAEYMIARSNALARIPDELSFLEAAPLVCAGITTYNCLRNSGARLGDVVAVLGLGGLGHLAVQFAAKGGFRTVAIARGKDKEPLARQFGAHHYIDSQSEKPSAPLQKLGGARVILATASSGEAMQSVVGGLAPNGTLMVIGAPPSMTIFPGQLIGGGFAIRGWHSGTAIDSQDTLAFSVLAGVRSLNQTLPLDRAAEAYEKMMNGQARFRMVLTI